MPVEDFRSAYTKYHAHRNPFTLEDMEDYRRLWKEMREGAKPGHVDRYEAEYMNDYVACSCGWKSAGHWDGYEYAEDEWREHVAEEFGLLPKKCICGKTYVPADGGKACHKLVEVE